MRTRGPGFVGHGDCSSDIVLLSSSGVVWDAPRSLSQPNMPFD
jgi:hypothetical protein